MALDRWIAFVVLLVALLYGYAAYNYPLLPFERNMSFLPNTLPMILSVLCAILSLWIMLVRAPEGDDAPGESEPGEWRHWRFGQALALVLAMVLYALLLRPVGFVAATVLFLAGGSWVLGERKLLVMLALAGVATVTVWYLVQELLGIYLSPWPALLGQATRPWYG